MTDVVSLGGRPAFHARFVHTADLQIGMTRGGFLDADAEARFEAARVAAVRRIGELASRESCAFIVMAGDIFEFNSVSDRTFGRAVEAFRQLPVDCYLLPGNHDALTADSILRRLVAQEGMERLHLLEDSQPVEVAEGVELVAAPLRARTATSDLVGQATAGLSPVRTIRVVVGHGQPQDYGEHRVDQIAIEPLEERLRSGAIDYVALGDTHSAQPVGKTGCVWFSGAPEVTQFSEPGGGGEFNSGKALVVDITKAEGSAEVAVAEHQVGQWRFQAVHSDLAGDEDVDGFLDSLRELDDKERTVVKYSLSGTISLTARQRLEHGLDQLQPVFAALYERHRVMDLATSPSEDELADLGLSGFAQSALEELIDAGEQDATNLLFRLARNVEAK
ncbi:metallophosphoesterase family protein [Corynebacterium atypicum]|uniref:metallophosphoesterase family protein n=1 Tax=Corynebacterium atypicum TaxID=191610 RepID=UPI00068ED9FB|nr:metallophosphoesterase [Corynebacterium atypicum]